MNQNFKNMKNLIILFFLATIFMAAFTCNAQNATQTCDPTTITKVEHEGAGNRITWTQPTGRGEVIITQSDNCLLGAIGYQQNSFGVYHRFIQEDLATINNGELLRVAFVPMFFPYQIQPGYTFTIQVYKGGVWGTMGNRNPGTLIASQELANANLVYMAENTVTLDTPISIDASQELWIGYYCTFQTDSIYSQHKFPAGSDGGPLNDGFGNLMFFNNQWITLYEFSDFFEDSFCIKGIVQTIEGTTVNIYCNDNNITSNIPGTTYFHPNPTGSEQCYKVEVNCLVGGVSPFSNVVCITETECHPATKLEVKYAADCSSADLTWRAPENMSGTILYNIYRNDTLLISNHGATSYTTSNFNPNALNVWSVKVVCPNEESDAVSITKEDCTVGVKDNKIVRFNIYPNPAGNELRITIAGQARNDEANVEIYDVYGRKISSNHLIASSSHHTINISSLSSGIYFIKLTNEQGSSMQRFTKN